MELTKMAHLNRLIHKYNAEEKRYFVKMHHAIDIIEVMIKTYVSAVVSIRSKKQPYSEELKKFVLSQFKRPSLGHWVGFGRKAALEILVPQTLTKEQFEQIMSGFNNNLKKTFSDWYTENEFGHYILHPINKLQGNSRDNILKILATKEIGLYSESEMKLAHDYYLFEKDLEGLINFRNAIAHGAVPTEERCKKSIIDYEREIQDSLKKDFFNMSSIVVFNENGIIKELEEEAVVFEVASDVEAFYQVHLIYKDIYINVYPLMLYEKSIVFENEGQERSFLNNVLFVNDLEDISKKKEVISTLHYTSGEHIKHKVDLEQFSKVMDLKKWKLELTSKQLMFEHIIADATSHFIGRRSELQQLKDFLLRDKGYYYTHALPGNGKTALYSSFYNELENTDVYRFCYFIRYIDDHHEEAFYAQLLTYIKDSFNITVQYQLKTLEEQRIHIANVLKKVSEHLIAANKKFVLIIDGLNEAPAQLLHLLPTSTYENVYCFYAAQNTEQVQCFIQNIQTPFFEESKLCGLTEADIRGLLYEVANKYELTQYESNNRTFIKNLHAKTDGNALYVQHLIQEIRDGKRKIGDLKNVPQSLNNYYESLLKNKIEAQQLVKEAILLLALAKGPMTATDLQYALQLEKLEQCKALLGKLQPFLKIGEGQYQLYHDAFRTYIKSSQCKSILPEEREFVKSQLINFCANYEQYIILEQKPKYPFLYFIDHLVDQKNDVKPKVEQLLNDPTYYQVQFEITNSYEYTFKLFRLALASYHDDELAEYLEQLEKLYRNINRSYTQQIQSFEASPNIIEQLLNYISHQSEAQYCWFVVGALYGCTVSRRIDSEQAVQTILSFIQTHQKSIKLKLDKYIEPNIYFKLMEKLEARFRSVSFNSLYEYYSPIAYLGEDIIEQIEEIDKMHLWSENTQWTEYRVKLVVQLLKVHSKRTDYLDIYWVMLKAKALNYPECLAAINEKISHYANDSSGIYTVARLDALAEYYEQHGEQEAKKYFESMFTEEDLEYLIEESKYLVPSWSKAFYDFLQQQLNNTALVTFEKWAYQLMKQAVEQKDFETALNLFIQCNDEAPIEMLYHRETYVKLAHIICEKHPDTALKLINSLVDHMLVNDQFQRDILPSIEKALMCYEHNGYSSFQAQVFYLLKKLDDNQLFEEIELIKKYLNSYYVNLWERTEKFYQCVERQNKEELLTFVAITPLHWVFEGELEQFLQPVLHQISSDYIKEIVSVQHFPYWTFKSVAGYLFDETSLIAYCERGLDEMRQKMHILVAFLPHFIEVHGVESAKRVIDQLRLTENEILFIIQNTTPQLDSSHRMYFYEHYPTNELTAIFIEDCLKNGISLNIVEGLWEKEAIAYLLENGYKKEALNAVKKWLAQEISQNELKNVLHLFYEYTSEQYVFKLMLEATTLARRETTFLDNGEKEIQDAIKEGIVQSIIKRNETNEWAIISELGSFTDKIRYAINGRDLTKLTSVVQEAIYINWNELSEEEKQYILEHVELAKLLKQEFSNQQAPLEVMQYALQHTVQNKYSFETLNMMLAFLTACTIPDRTLLQQAVDLHMELQRYTDDRYTYLQLVMLQEFCEIHCAKVLVPLKLPTVNQVEEAGRFDFIDEFIYLDFLYDSRQQGRAREYAKEIFACILCEDNEVRFEGDILVKTLVKLDLHDEVAQLLKINLDFLPFVSEFYMETGKYTALNQQYEFILEDEQLEEETRHCIEIKRAIDLNYISALKGSHNATQFKQIMLDIQDSPNYHEYYVQNLIPLIIYKNDWALIEEIIAFFGHSSICGLLVAAYCEHQDEIHYLERILTVIESLHLPLEKQRSLIEKIIKKIGYSHPNGFKILITTLSYICHDERLFSYWTVAKNTYIPFKEDNIW